MKKPWFFKLLLRRAFVFLMLLVQIFVLYFLIGDNRYAASISSALSVVSLFIALHIVFKKNKGAYKLSWIFLVLLFPVFGCTIYFLVNNEHLISNKRKALEIIDADLKPYFNIGRQADPSGGLYGKYCRQISYLQSFAGFPAYAKTNATYLSPGECKLEALLKDLRSAEKYIFLEYFIVDPGIMWDGILDILIEKAAAGVDVRLLYDDVGCFLLLPSDYPDKLKKLGIDCRVFNRFKPLLSAKQNNRDHRKICSIDGKIAYTGGINLADEYINQKERFGHWKDSAVRIEGEAAWSLTLIFLQLWLAASGRSDDVSLLYPWKASPCPIEDDGLVVPYADCPGDPDNVCEHVYIQIINSAKDYVYINTPYLIIDDSMASALILAAKSGVDVRIVTPHKWDKRLVHFTTRSYYPDLIRGGVQIYEYTPGFIHSKTMVSDDNVASIGSANLDFRSLYLNFEAGVVLFESKAVLELKEDYLKTLSNCERITESDCQASWFKRLIQELFRVFSPLM